MKNETNQKEIKRVCSVCGQENYDDWFKPPQSPGPVVQCKGCGFVYVNPVQSAQALINEGPVLHDRPTKLLESASLEDIQGSWEEPIITNYLSELETKKLNAQDALLHINNLVSNRGRILDIGCFCGVFLSVADENKWDCYGIEPLVMPAIYARGHFDLKVTTDTLRSDTYPSKFFDVVTAFQVFEHLTYPRKEIEKIHKILKPSGLLLIEVPNIDTIMVKLLGEKHRHFVQDHVSFFSATTLSQLLEDMGFQIKKVYYPTRVLSLRHFIWWLKKYNQRLSNGVTNILPNVIVQKPIRVNFRDIVAVIAEKK